MLNILFWTLTIALKPITMIPQGELVQLLLSLLVKKSKTLEGKGDAGYPILHGIIYRHIVVSCCLKEKKPLGN